MLVDFIGLADRPLAQELRKLLLHPVQPIPPSTKELKRQRLTAPLAPLEMIYYKFLMIIVGFGINILYTYFLFF